MGRVRDIVIDPAGDLVRVRFRIATSMILPDDPVVILSPESLFGDWQAEIHPRSRFPYFAYPIPHDADILPGHALPDISQLTATADQIAESISTLTERVGIAFSEETARNIASLIDNVEEVTNRLSELISQQATSFTGVTEELRTATQSIGAAADQARSSFETVENLLTREEVNSTLSDLAVISSNLRTLSVDLQGTNDEVRGMASRMDSTFARVQALVARVEAGEGSIGRLLQDPETATQLEAALMEVRALLVDIRENPRRYIRLSIF